jgi:hypothetical protein
MPIFDVVVRSRVWVEAETREEAAEDARRILARGWWNMALGYDAIISNTKGKKSTFDIDRKQSGIDGRVGPRQDVTYEEPDESY